MLTSERFICRGGGSKGDPDHLPERRLSKNYSKKLMQQCGSVMIETSLSISVLVFLFLGTAELVRLAYFAISLDYVISRGARWAVVGQCLTSAGSQVRCTDPGALSREQSIKSFVKKTGARFRLYLNDSEIKICKVGTACPPESAGNTGDRFNVSANYRPSLIFGAVRPTLQAFAFATSEPYE